MNNPAEHREAPPAVSAKAASIKALSPVYELVAKDFQAVNHLIPRKLTSDVALVSEIGNYITESGGKRLRPLMVLLASRALGYDGRAHIQVAAIIEFLHTATLLHDDVVDRSGMRRGKLTANEKWGNAPSVLVGDFLYSRAFQLMVEVGSMDVMAVLADATNTIAEGEVMQLANVGRIDLDEPAYREIIRCKTALLFEAATHTGALLAEDSARHTDALTRFGRHFGITYQLVDDWLDYEGDSTKMGKNVGDDLAEGKLTLPLIQALKTACEADACVVRDAVRKKDVTALPRVIDVVRDSGALEYTREMAAQEAELALACLNELPSNAYVEALVTLTEYSTSRLF